MNTRLLVLLLLLFALNANGQETGNRLLNVGEMRADFNQLREILENEQGNLYEYTSKQSYDAMFAKQYSLINRPMRMNEFFRILVPLTASTGCGHTSVWMPGSYWAEGSDNMFPLIFKWLGQDAVVTGAYSGEPAVPPGTIILELNGRPMKEILEDIYETAPSDAMIPYGRRMAAARRFPMYYTRLYGFPDSYVVTCLLPGSGEKLTITLEPATNEAARKVVFSNFNNPELSLEIKDEGRVAIMTINSFIYYDRKDYFRAFLDSCFAEIKSRRCNKLILDLRKNDGGDPWAAAALFSYLEPAPLPYYAEPYHNYEELAKPIPVAENRFNGNLEILIDSRCFSTNSHLCALLKYHKIGTLIGTPSAGTYTCNGGRDGVRTLENSRIMLYFTRAAYAVAVEGMDKTKAIMPDILVEETWRDIWEGRDRVMEIALER